jgi:hypothetical protein
MATLARLSGKEFPALAGGQINVSKLQFFYRPILKGSRPMIGRKG